MSLAIEFQGQQHFHWHFKYGSPQTQQLRDQEKRDACYKNGITLIEIPYWDAQTKESIMQQIEQQSSSGCS